MEKDPRDLSEEELIARLRQDEKEADVAESVEENSPTDLEEIGDEDYKPTQGN
jgi:hypothetical protein